MFKKWDSINLESEYRKMIMSRKNRISTTAITQRLRLDEPVLVQVLDNLYEVNLDTRKCYPIYQKCGRKIKVQRCLWYRDTNEPFDEHVGEEIEKRHVELFREILMNQMLSSSPASSTLEVNAASATATFSLMDDQAFESSSVDSTTSTSSNPKSTSANSSSKNSKNDSSKGQVERNFL